MKRQTLVPKGSLSRLFQEAAEAWRRQDYQETIALLERASRLEPGNISVLFDLCRTYSRLLYQLIAEHGGLNAHMGQSFVDSDLLLPGRCFITFCS